MGSYLQYVCNSPNHMLPMAGGGGGHLTDGPLAACNTGGIHVVFHSFPSPRHQYYHLFLPTSPTRPQAERTWGWAGTNDLGHVGLPCVPIAGYLVNTNVSGVYVCSGFVKPSGIGNKMKKDEKLLYKFVPVCLFGFSNILPLLYPKKTETSKRTGRHPNTHKQ